MKQLIQESLIFVTVIGPEVILQKEGISWKPITVPAAVILYELR